MLETKEFKNIGGVNVKLTEIRETMLPIPIGVYDAENRKFDLIEYIQDPALIDPRPWYKYYK